MTTRMSTVLVLVAVVAFGCSDTAAGPDPGDIQRADGGVEDEDPSNRDPTSDQARNAGSGTGEGGESDDEGGEERSGSESYSLGPPEFRARWNELVGATDDGSLQAEYLGMGELQPANGDTVDAEIGRGGAATVTATLSADETLTAITIRLLDDPNAPQPRRALTQATLPRLLLASTLPSQPGPNDPAVTGSAEALELQQAHGTETVVAEGITYSARSDEDSWTLIAQLAP